MTVAPGTTPFGSLTVPTMVPVVTWAVIVAVQADEITADNTAAKSRRFIMAAPPLNQPRLRSRVNESIEDRSCGEPATGARQSQLFTPRGLAPRTPQHARSRGPRDPRAARVGSLARSFATFVLAYSV